MLRIAAAAAAALAAVLAVLVPAGQAQATTTGHYFSIGGIYFDSPGSDTGTSASVNGEYFTVKNVTGAAHNISGWTVTDRQGHRYTFPGISVAKGAHITVHTGKGTNTTATRYWGLGYYVWNNDGDTATLRGPGGTTWDTCSYTAANDPVKVC